MMLDVFKDVEALSVDTAGGRLEFVDKFMLKMLSKWKNRLRKSIIKPKRTLLLRLCTI